MKYIIVAILFLLIAVWFSTVHRWGEMMIFWAFFTGSIVYFAGTEKSNKEGTRNEKYEV